MSPYTFNCKLLEDSRLYPNCKSFAWAASTGDSVGRQGPKGSGGGFTLEEIKRRGKERGNL